MNIEDIPEWISTDELKFIQIINNLLSNAIKFTPDNGNVLITVQQVPAKKLNDQKILIRNEQGAFQTSDQYLRISIIDSGIGIKQRNLNTLFMPFKHADCIQERMENGSGLGLSVVKKHVEALGGTISVESKGTGKGSNFTVNLPLLKEVKNSRRGPPGSDSVAVNI